MIKLYKDDNYSILINIWERSVLSTHHFLTREDFEFYKEKVPFFFPQAKIYVFEEENKIKGFLGLSYDNIDMLFVDSSYIGQGVGKSLLLYAINVLGYTKVDVNEQNIKAYNFYQKFGFREAAYSEKDGFGKSYPIIHLQLV